MKKSKTYKGRPIEELEKEQGKSDRAMKRGTSDGHMVTRMQPIEKSLKAISKEKTARKKAVGKSYKAENLTKYHDIDKARKMAEKKGEA